MDPKHFRQVLGQYPTGVVIVTSVSAQGEALGMTVGSFTSVSLDPPLVAFLPDKASSSWKALRESGPRFCVNVLAAQQEDVCRAVASRKVNKFHDVRWRPSAAGNPIIDGAVAYIDCTVEAIHDAGDHHIVIGRVHDLDLTGTGHPLLFFRGGYGSFRPQSLAAGDADLVEQLKLVDRVRTNMEGLADRFGTEVTVVCLVNDQLVLTAAAGNTRSPDRSTRVGLRLPFMPPVGSVNAAWGSAELRERWLANLHPGTSPEETARMRRGAPRPVPRRIQRPSPRRARCAGRGGSGRPTTTRPPGGQRRCSRGLQEQGDALADTDAHRHHRVPRIAAPQLARCGEGQAHAAHAQRMPERDGATVGVDMFGVVG